MFRTIAMLAILALPSMLSAQMPGVLRQVVMEVPLDPDARAWKARAEANGGSVSGRTLRAVSNFVRGCKGDGLWPSITACGVFAGQVDLNSALTAIKGPPQLVVTNDNFVSADLSATGLKGDGIAKRIRLQDMVFPISTILSSLHFGAWETELNTVANGGPIGSTTGTTSFHSLAEPTPGSGTNIVFRISDNFDGTVSKGTPGTGMRFASRVAASGEGAAFAAVNSTIVARNFASNAVDDIQMQIFRPRNGSQPYSDARLSFWTCGAGMSQSQYLQYLARINRLMSDLGVSVQ